MQPMDQAEIAQDKMWFNQQISDVAEEDEEQSLSVDGGTAHSPLAIRLSILTSACSLV